MNDGAACAKPNKQGKYTMFIWDGEIVIVGRKWRSKWWSVSCTCRTRKRRKDGTCRHERVLLSQLLPDIRKRARIQPMGETK